MDILRDSVWQFIGAVLGLIAVAATLLIYFLQKTRKELSYDIIFNTNLLSINAKIKDSMQVNWRGKEINGLNLLIVRLRNSGNTPIVATDYEGPVIFTFDKDDRVLEAEIESTQPPNIPASLETTASSVQLKPSLLNPKDYIEIKILLTSYKNMVVQGRIINIETIKMGSSFPDWNDVPLATFFGISTAIAILGVFYLPTGLIVNNFVAEVYKVPQYSLIFFGGYLIIYLFQLFIFIVLRREFENKSKIFKV